MLRARNRNGVVRILKNVVLGTIAEIIEIGVEWWGVCPLVHLAVTVRAWLWFVGCAETTHVISLGLEPVKWVFGTVSAVAGCSFHDTVSRVGAASAGDLGFGQRDVRRRSSNIALEPGHIVYTAKMNSERSSFVKKEEKKTDFVRHHCQGSGSRTKRSGTLPEGRVACWRGLGNL